MPITPGRRRGLVLAGRRVILPVFNGWAPVARKSRARAHKLIRKLVRKLEPLARFLLRSQLLTVFLVLCVAGIIVGLESRPDRSVVPYADLFREMSVVSYRESPSDTTAHFVVDLCAGGKVFRRYDVDAAAFTAPPRDRDYNRAITSTVYHPLQVRGHVARGLWLDMPRLVRPSLLPEQFDELYRATLDLVKPVSLVAGAVGTLSGYSVGYRLGIWNSSLRSRTVQERVLATPGLGRVIAREAWRRVLLEPLVMATESDTKRLAATCAIQRIYSNFFRLALNDSDSFIPREASRLASLGRAYESRTMLAFAEAVGRARLDAPVSNADFDAVERWASLLVRRGHWAADAIPPAGEERARYLGTLTWYGVAPPTPEVNRIWVGARLLVREGEMEGFVADEVPATGVGCPIGWRAELLEQTSGTNAWAIAWFADHPEFRSLAMLVGRVAVGTAKRAQQLAARRSHRVAEPTSVRPVTPATAVLASANRVTAIAAPSESAAHAARHDTVARDTLRSPTQAPADTLRAPSSVPVRADSTRADSDTS